MGGVDEEDHGREGCHEGAEPGQVAADEDACCAYASDAEQGADFSVMSGMQVPDGGDSECDEEESAR